MAVTTLANAAQVASVDAKVDALPYPVADFAGLSSITPVNVAVGGSVVNKATGDFYARANDAATDFHLDYSGSGGIKLYYVPQNDIINVNAFGINAANTSAVNQAQAYILRDWLRLFPTKRYTIFFPSSDAIYRFNRSDWTRGIARWKVSGYGAKIMSDDGTFANFGLSVYTWYTNAGMFYDYDARLASGDTDKSPIMGSLISTTPRGSLDVTVSGDTSGFAVGHNVVIYGQQYQDNGYPPNARKFEYNVVKAISGQIITLESPTQYRYRSDWPEDTSSYPWAHGPARILSLNRTDFTFCESAEIEGITIVGIDGDSNAAKDNGFLNTNGCKSIKVKDVVCDRYVPQECGSIVLENLTVKASMELDKMVSDLSITRCDFPYLNEGSGIDRFVMQDSQIRNFDPLTGLARYSYLRCRNKNVQRNRFMRAGTLAGRPIVLDPRFDSGGGQIKIKDNTFQVLETDDFSSNTRGVLGSFEMFRTRDIGAVSSLGGRLYDVTVPNSSFGAEVLFEEGRPVLIYSSDGTGSSAGYITGVRAGPVAGLEEDVIVTMELDSAPSSGWEAMVPVWSNVDISGNEVLASDGQFVRQTEDMKFNINGGVLEIDLITDFASSIWYLRQVPVFGYLSSYTVEMLRPYTGVEANAVVRVELRRGNRRIISVHDATAIGRYVIDPASTPAIPNEPIATLSFGSSSDGGSPTDAAAAMMVARLSARIVPISRRYS